MYMNVYYLSLKKETPKNDYWDYGMLQDILSRIPETKFHEVDTLPKTERAIVVLPARHHAGLEDKVNQELKKIDYKIFFAMGDEEAVFDIDQIISDHIYVQNPHPQKHEKYNKIGTGYPIQSVQHLKNKPYNKNLDVFFSGQVTHVRRELMMRYMRDIAATNNQVVINATDGFTRGMDHPEYYDHMSRAKIVTCPSGAVIPDSFRLFESLESMAVPIADEVNPSGSILTYWDWLFEQNTPFPKIQNWSEVAEIIRQVNEDPELIHKITAWWIKYKRDLKLKIIEQYND